MQLSGLPEHRFRSLGMHTLKCFSQQVPVFEFLGAAESCEPTDMWPMPKPTTIAEQFDKYNPFEKTLLLAANVLGQYFHLQRLKSSSASSSTSCRPIGTGASTMCSSITCRVRFTKVVRVETARETRSSTTEQPSTASGRGTFSSVRLAPRRARRTSRDTIPPANTDTATSSSAWFASPTK